MTENTYYKPRLVIGGKDITKSMSGSVTFSGSNRPNSCSCTIADPSFQNYKLYNQELKVYLNYGSEDGAPIFRGYIKEVQPNDKQTKIVAMDSRMFITGAGSRMIELTNDSNYDGYTLAGFLYDFINVTVNNNNNTYIGLDYLRDTEPTISMSGERNKPTPALTVVDKLIKKAVDESDLEKPLNYFIDMIDDGIKSNIVFVKEKQLTEAPSLYLSFSDGIISYKNNRRAPATYAVGGGTTFQYTSEPRGSVGINLTGTFKDRNEARTEAIKKILLEHRETDELTIQSTKGHYIAIGSIVHVKTEDEDIGGNHRVTSKKISFGAGGIKLALSLNKKPIILSDYIN